jgi:hypothetical protein
MTSRLPISSGQVRRTQIVTIPALIACPHVRSAQAMWAAENHDQQAEKQLGAG